MDSRVRRTGSSSKTTAKARQSSGGGGTVSVASSVNERFFLAAKLAFHCSMEARGGAQTYAECLNVAGRATALDIKRLESILGGDSSESRDQLAPNVDFEVG